MSEDKESFQWRNRFGGTVLECCASFGVCQKQWAFYQESKLIVLITAPPPSPSLPPPPPPSLLPPQPPPPPPHTRWEADYKRIKPCTYIIFDLRWNSLRSFQCGSIRFLFRSKTPPLSVSLSLSLSPSLPPSLSLSHLRCFLVKY